MTTLRSSDYTRKNSFFALAALVIDRGRYLEMATEHDTAVALSSPDLRLAYERGTVTIEWHNSIKEQSRIYMHSLTGSIRSAVIASSWVMLAVAVAAVLFGFVRPELQFDKGKIVTVVGGYIALSAAALQLYPVVQTNKGEALHEHVHASLTRVLSALAAIGIFASLM